MAALFDICETCRRQCVIWYNFGAEWYSIHFGVCVP